MTGPASDQVLLLAMAELKASRTEIAQLREALTSRGLIDRAEGMIMLAFKCDADRAFAILLAASQREGVTHHDLAAGLCIDAASGLGDGLAATVGTAVTIEGQDSGELRSAGRVEVGLVAQVD
jgi:hypothetical protein